MNDIEANATEPRTQTHSPKTSKLRSGDKIAASALILIFLAFAFEGRDLEFGNLTSPGPGLWPKIILCLALLCSVLIFIFGRDKMIPNESGSYRKLLFYILALLLLPALYPFLGFIIPAFLSLAMLFYTDAKLSILKTFIIAASASLIIYGIFGMALSLPIQPI